MARESQWEVPDPMPGESVYAYRLRLHEHTGRLLDHVVQAYAERGVDLPEWLAALAALRKAGGNA